MFWCAVSGGFGYPLVATSRKYVEPRSRKLFGHRGFVLAMTAGRRSFLGGFLGDAEAFLGGHPLQHGSLCFARSHPRFGALLALSSRLGCG